MKKGSGICDVVYTPKSLAQQIVSHFNPLGRVLDPCRGEGAFDNERITDWCEISNGKDFFDWKESVDWVIGNPPWSIYQKFNEHALDISKNVVWIYHIAGLMTKRRIKDATDRGFHLRELILHDTPLPPWPQSGFQVATAWWSKEAGEMKLTDWRKNVR